MPDRGTSVVTKSPWQARVGAALAGVVAVLYVVLATGGDVVDEDVTAVVGIAASLFIAAVCATGAVLVRSRRATVVLLAVAVVPLLIWGLLSMTIGPLLLLAAGFLIAALVKVVSQGRGEEPAQAEYGKTDPIGRSDR